MFAQAWFWVESTTQIAKEGSDQNLKPQLSVRGKGSRNGKALGTN